jgi:hypothetical protein
MGSLARSRKAGHDEPDDGFQGNAPVFCGDLLRSQIGELIEHVNRRVHDHRLTQLVTAVRGGDEVV